MIAAGSAATIHLPWYRGLYVFLPWLALLILVLPQRKSGFGQLWILVPAVLLFAILRACELFWGSQQNMEVIDLLLIGSLMVCAYWATPWESLTRIRGTVHALCVAILLVALQIPSTSFDLEAPYLLMMLFMLFLLFGFLRVTGFSCRRGFSMWLFTRRLLAWAVVGSFVGLQIFFFLALLLSEPTRVFSRYTREFLTLVQIGLAAGGIFCGYYAFFLLLSFLNPLFRERLRSSVPLLPPPAPVEAVQETSATDDAEDEQIISGDSQ